MQKYKNCKFVLYDHNSSITEFPRAQKMTYYDEKYPDSTFYSSSHAPYDMGSYQPGCGLRKRRPPSSDYYYRKSYGYACCDSRQLQPSPCRNCDCSLRNQPRCLCGCSHKPSLYCKLLLAPYTKLSSKSDKKSSKNRQTQTEPQQRPAPSILINQRPTQYLAPQVQYQQPVPVTFKIQSQPYQHQPQPQIHIQGVPPQQMHLSQPMHVSRPLHQNIVYQLASNQPRGSSLHKSRSNISFNAIPINTQQEINPTVYQKQPLVLQPVNHNIVRQVEEKPTLRPSLVLKPTNSQMETPSGEDQSNMSIKVTNEHKSSSVVLKKPERQPVQQPVPAVQPSFPFNMATNNTASFGNFMQMNSTNMQSSQNQVSFTAQQKSQQVSYSSSQSQSKQTYSKTIEMEKKDSSMIEGTNESNPMKGSSRRMLTSNAQIMEKLDYDEDEN